MEFFSQELRGRESHERRLRIYSLLVLQINNSLENKWVCRAIAKYIYLSRILVHYEKSCFFLDFKNKIFVLILKILHEKWFIFYKKTSFDFPWWGSIIIWTFIRDNKNFTDWFINLEDDPLHPKNELNQSNVDIFGSIPGLLWWMDPFFCRTFDKVNHVTI